MLRDIGRVLQKPLFPPSPLAFSRRRGGLRVSVFTGPTVHGQLAALRKRRGRSRHPGTSGRTCSGIRGHRGGPHGPWPACSVWVWGTTGCAPARCVRRRPRSVISPAPCHPPGGAALSRSQSWAGWACRVQPRLRLQPPSLLRARTEHAQAAAPRVWTEPRPRPRSRIPRTSGVARTRAGFQGRHRARVTSSVTSFRCLMRL